MLGDFSSGSLNSLGHFIKDMHPALFGLGQCLSHDITINAVDLDIHLQRGNPIFRSYNLEIHITKMILITQDIRKNDNLVTLFDESHGNS